MPAIMTTIDDQSIGRGFGDFFTPDNTKKRVAFIPFFLSKAEVSIPDELREKSKTDFEAAKILARKIKFLSALETGAEAEPPTVLRTMDPPGYVFSRMDGAMVHFHKDAKFFYCKAQEYKDEGREPICCKFSVDKFGKPQDAMLTHGFVVLEYMCDPQGNIPKIPLEMQQPIPGENQFKLDFKYTLKTWAINEAKLKQLKRFKDQFPTVSCDYLVWNEKHGASDRTNFSPCPPPARWRSRGTVLIDMIMNETLKPWEKVDRTIGKNFSVQQIDEMFGIAPRQQAPEKPKVERTFSQILGT